MIELEAKQGKRASTWYNGGFVLVETYSGRVRMGFDPQGVQYLFPPDTSDESLGWALLDALRASRFLSIEEAVLFFDPKRTTEEYTKRTRLLMVQYGYRTKRALLMKMKNCGIQMVGENITVRPTTHEKLEGWGRTRDDGIEDVVIPSGSPPADIGAALRLAFARCK